MSEERIVRYDPKRDRKPESRTDWDRVRAMSDDEVEAAAAADPDNPPLSEAQLADVFRPADLRELRRSLGLSQAQFSRRYGIPMATLQDWEQARRVPDTVSRNYLRVIRRDPEAVAKALAS
ncbi:helix-turn-helix domain-containing protein [Arenibaculum sp.]|uniref:helix-turn-helix domain-containing protein n=1 Tax=Arenibaculum sp. TaxID=2865862 RepID=UPI002E162487|nr:helix-turn-helix domain-containing protein [Arenibaculum sp.]